MDEGLHQLIARKRAHVAGLEERVRGGGLEPRDEHRVRGDIDAQEAELVELCAAANQGEMVHAEMAGVLAGMKSLRPKTNALRQAVECQETALWRLRLHLGESPEGKEADNA